jgi:hypothetical protein
VDNPIEEQAILVTGPLTEAELPGVLAVELNCPKCTGPMVKCDIGYVGIYGWWLERTKRMASVLGPRRAVASDVFARVCIRCGYTELYATDPKGLVAGDDAGDGAN